MKYSEVVDVIASKTEISKADVKKALDAAVEVIGDVLVSKDSVNIPGLGVFSSKDKPAGKARNPSTGETIDVAAKTVAKFKASKGLADKVNA